MKIDTHIKIPTILLLAGLCSLLLNGSALQAGAASSKAAEAKEVSLQALMKAGPLGRDKALLLLKQHPGLNADLVKQVISRVKGRENRTGSHYGEAQFMSKFALYASEMVGWQGDK